MTERELFEALRDMMPNAVNVIGFHDLFDTEDYDPPPIKRIEGECHIAAGGHALAFQAVRLFQRLSEEGIEP
ncbi:hypothetical protein [Aureimonas psammosilenae]|uniref:hypothetical protein n=1 Tax=Aureimonas psammosilenae TaxID=2495496 RepID=UPI001260B0C8|nr:hypothetical protein [Aureimonas psammosilenae]